MAYCSQASNQNCQQKENSNGLVILTQQHLLQEICRVKRIKSTECTQERMQPLLSIHLWQLTAQIPTHQRHHQVEHSIMLLILVIQKVDYIPGVQLSHLCQHL